MNRRLFRLLLGVAFLAWGVAGWQLWQAWRIAPSQVSTEGAYASSSMPVDTCRRDPFALGYALPAVDLRRPMVPPASVRAVIESPQLPPLPHWEGYMDGAPAMVLLKAGGRTEIAKEGDSVFGWKVVSVSSGGARLRCGSAKAAVVP